jgi:immunoglobulin-binding protein 1
MPIMSEGAKPAGNDETGSIAERYHEAVQQVASAPSEAVAKLELLRRDVSALALFSSNEGMDDISTKSLSLLSLEHHLAMATLALPTAVGQSKERRARIVQSMVLFAAFLQRLETLEFLSESHIRDLHELLDTNAEDCEEPSQQQQLLPRMTAGQHREAKIARFRAKQQVQSDVQRLESTQQRRGRLGVQPQEEMDGHDQDSLERALVLKSLEICATEAIDEWLQALRELPMIDMAIQMEEQRCAMDRHRGGPPMDDSRPPPSNKPLQLTHITLDSMTGQLNIRKEEVLSQVFRPGWNQPTMSLEELGDREREQAIERGAQQKISEEQQKHQPRRYEQLLKDGMEDNKDLVDASAELDRKWDDWKAENPRGSGNKMGDRGDRNF